VLAYDYSAGSARLDDLPERPISPHLYVLCDRCASSLRAPRGWILDDRRGAPAPARQAPAPPAAAPEPAIGADDGQRQLAFGYSA
jgi:hypothetical protein